jgi:hypothetical protein
MNINQVRSEEARLEREENGEICNSSRCSFAFSLPLLLLLFQGRNLNGRPVGSPQQQTNNKIESKQRNGKKVKKNTQPLLSFSCPRSIGLQMVI